MFNLLNDLIKIILKASLNKFPRGGTAEDQQAKNVIVR